MKMKTMAPRAVTRASEKLEQIANLRRWLPQGSTVYTVLRSVSRSGMMRHISLKALDPATGMMLDVTQAFAKVCGYRLVDSLGGMNAVKVGGYALRQRWI